MAATGAEYVVAFGGGSEVSGSYLVDIEGYGRPTYELPYVLDGIRSAMGMRNTMAVFRRQTTTTKGNM